MELTRAQEQRISQLEEFKAETKHQFDVILGMLSRLQGIQESDDRSALDRDTSPSMKAWRSGSDHFERSGDDRWFSEEDRRFRDYLMLRNNDDDETWTWTEHYSVMDDETDFLEEKSTSQFQVPIANSEIVRSIEPGKVDLGFENEEYVVLNENLEQERDQMNVNEKLEVNGVVERGQKMISDANTCCAHKVFVKMPSKEKRIKHLKGWKFKFKPTSKRSRLMDDKFSFVDATVLLNRDLQEIIWDCVNKEFKEIVAGCGKIRVDQFKLVHATPRPGVYDRPLQTHVRDSGGSLLECVDEKSFGNDRFREVIAIVKLTQKPWDNQVWEPGGVLIEHDKWTWLETCYNHGRLMRFRHWMSSMCWKGTQDWIVSIWSKIQVFSDFDIASFIGLEICGFETKKHVLLLTKLANRVWECGELLATSQKMQKMDLFSFDTHTEMEENVELKQLLVAMERFSQEVLEQKIEGGLSCGDVKFHLKHKWRFRLLESFSVVKFGKYKACDALLLLMPSDERFQIKHNWRFRLSHSFSELKQRKIGRVWKSFGYLMEDMMEEDHKLQGDSEPLLPVPDFAAKICEAFGQYIREKGYVSADRESESNQPTLRFSTWVVEILLNHYMVLLLTPVAYAIQFLGGVGMDKKQSHLSLWINRVWDPGRSLVKDASYSARIFSSLPATVPVSLLCQESFAYQITSFFTNLEVKVSLKGEDVIQDKGREESRT